MPIVVDTSTLPLLKIRYDGPFSDEELERLFRALEGVLKRDGQMAAVIDLRTAVAPPANQRRAQGEWIHKNERKLGRKVMAAAIVTDSAIMRGVVTAIFWVRPLPCPTRVVPDLALAREWIEPFVQAAREAT
jgi:hypothetical protein